MNVRRLDLWYSCLAKSLIKPNTLSFTPLKNWNGCDNKGLTWLGTLCRRLSRGTEEIHDECGTSWSVGSVSKLGLSVTKRSAVQPVVFYWRFYPGISEKKNKKSCSSNCVFPSKSESGISKEKAGFLTALSLHTGIELIGKTKWNFLHVRVQVMSDYLFEDLNLSK